MELGITFFALLIAGLLLGITLWLKSRYIQRGAVAVALILAVVSVTLEPFTFDELMIHLTAFNVPIIISWTTYWLSNRFLMKKETS